MAENRIRKIKVTRNRRKQKLTRAAGDVITGAGFAVAVMLLIPVGVLAFLIGMIRSVSGRMASWIRERGMDRAGTALSFCLVRAAAGSGKGTESRIV